VVLDLNILILISSPSRDKAQMVCACVVAGIVVVVCSDTVGHLNRRIIHLVSSWVLMRSSKVRSGISV